ncbi:hypothetical protein FD755_017319, partial [Muntiacus reevesi]
QAVRHSNLKENRGRLPHGSFPQAIPGKPLDSAHPPPKERWLSGVPRSLPFGDGGKFHIEFLFPVSLLTVHRTPPPNFFQHSQVQDVQNISSAQVSAFRALVYFSKNFIRIFLVKTPWFNGWGFNLPRGQSLLDKWNLIPEGIDILMTHGPPLGFRDWVPKELQRVGCVELLNTVQRRVRPKLHVFGGIHEGYGIMTDGYTTYINASTCTVSFQPTNPPIIFDLPNPQGS